MVGLLPFVVAGGNRPVLLETTDQAFDRVAFAIGVAIEADPAPGLVPAAGDDRADVATVQILPGLLTGVGLVADHACGPGARSAMAATHRPGLQQDRQQRRFMGVTWGDGKGQRMAPAVGAQVDLGRQPALRAPKRLITAPFLAPAAWAWARTMVESSTCRAQSSSPAASASAVSVARMRSQIPACCQRRKREYTVCHGPYRSGRSRQGAPVRSRHTIPLMMVRWSWLGRPVAGRSGGSNGAKRAHCSSVSSCRRCGVIPQRYHPFANTP